RRVESYRSFRRNGRLQHLLDGCEYRLKSGVVFALHFLDFSPQLLVCGQHTSQLHKRAHDRDVHLHGAVTPKTLESMATPCSVNAYGRALRAPPQLEVTICDFKLFSSSESMQRTRKLPRFGCTPALSPIAS